MNGSDAPGIVVFGGINMDLVTYSDRFPSDGETVVGQRLLTYAGGKGANQAVAAARMGGRTSLVGRVGDDIFGGQLLDGLREAGVDVSRVAVWPGETSGIAVISIDGSAQNRIVQVLGANATCGEAEAARTIEAVSTASVLMLQLEVSMEASLAAARAANSSGKIVVLDPGPIRRVPDELVQLSSVITPNETEAEALVGFAVDGPDSAGRAAEALLDRGVGAAVIKLGAQSAYFATPELSGIQQPLAVNAVDTVAAGDAFNGALAVSLAEGKTLPDTVRIACAAGALAVTTTGAQDSMPARNAVEELLGSE